ncbi:MAG TPA: PPC domain-containing protein [Longimicrobium sp.]|nr:PPC domain-containing protein [Longimicrobium sp.]
MRPTISGAGESTLRIARTMLCLAATLAAAAPAVAQRGVPALRMEDSVRVTLSAADPALRAWGGYRAFRFDAQPGRIYQFQARRDTGSVGLLVVRTAGVLTDYVASSGGGTVETRAGTRVVEPGPTDGSASLRWRPAAAGTYLLVLASPDAGEVTLHADEIVAVPAAPRPVVPGVPVQGELNARSGVAVEDSSEFAYDLYTFSASRGQTLALVVTGEVDYGIGRMLHGGFAELAAGDTAWGTGAFTIPEDGEYAVRVRGMPDGAEGLPYRLRLVDPRIRPEPRRLEVGRPLDARFDALAAFTAEGRLVDEFVVYGSMGQRLQFSARSRAFDTYLELGRMGATGWEEIVANDDDDGTNSRLVHVVAQAGEYLVRVRPYGALPDSAAPYTVLVEPAEVTAAVLAVTRRTRPETRPVRWGAEMAGTLDDADAAVEDGTPYDAWTFSATAGQRIIITLRSTDFDSYLAVGREEDGEWMELTSNDDMLDGMPHARVVMVAPDTGEYTIRVNSFLSSPNGAYVLTAERQR